MLFDHTKKIVLLSFGLVLLQGLSVLGQQYYFPSSIPAQNGSTAPSPGSVYSYQMQPVPQRVQPTAYQAQPTAYQAGYQAQPTGYQARPTGYQVRPTEYREPMVPHQDPAPYTPSGLRVAQLPNNGAPVPSNPDQPGVDSSLVAPSLAPQRSTTTNVNTGVNAGTNLNASTNQVPKPFQPKPSSPVVVRPATAAPQTAAAPQGPGTVPGGVLPNPTGTIMRKLENASEKMEMVVNTSRILTLDKSIPQAQVNNPEILSLTPLSPKQIQLSAKKPGVTQVNIWSNDGQIYSIDVLVVGDAQELRVILQGQFPSSSLRVVPVGLGGEGSGSVYISGYVDRPEDVTQITQIAEQYYPKVINNVTVSGVQQVLLHAKVMEVSRTKLRTLGVDWAQISGNNLVASSVSGLLGGVSAASEQLTTHPVTGEAMLEVTPPSVLTSGNPTFQFNVIDGDNAFFGILEALREDQLAKVLACPTLVTVNGQPASFLVGGEVPVPVPQSLGTISIEYKKYGVQLNFVPLVLGDGRIRMEVRPRVSELDRSTALFMDGYYIYGFRSREVKTSVEMKAGQTLAIAGLINERTESERRGLPWISDVPVVGAFFRRTTEKNNEIEMLAFVTPELVDAMDPDEVPPGGPGMNSCRPTDFELHWKGHIETDCSNTGCGSGCNTCGYNAPGYGTSACGTPACTNAPYETGSGQPQYVPADSEGFLPQKAPTPSPATSSYQTPQNRYSPQNQVRQASRTALPGFQGQLGY